MEATELLKKIRKLEQGQAQIKREISKIVPSAPQFAICLRAPPADAPAALPGTIGVVAAYYPREEQREIRLARAEQDAEM
ncbi:hypothetical protein ABZP36_013081 [Zizania latifolia]